MLDAGKPIDQIKICQRNTYLLHTIDRSTPRDDKSTKK